MSDGVFMASNGTSGQREETVLIGDSFPALCFLIPVLLRA